MEEAISLLEHLEQNSGDYHLSRKVHSKIVRNFTSSPLHSIELGDIKTLPFENTKVFFFPSAILDAELEDKCSSMEKIWREGRDQESVPCLEKITGEFELRFLVS